MASVGTAARAETKSWDGDAGPFLKVGYATVDGMSGPAIVSPRAFYLLKAAEAAGGQGGGLARALLNEAFKRSGRDLRSGSIEQMPQAVQRELDPKSKLAGRDIVVLPKGAVGRVAVPRLNNQVTVHLGQERFPVITGVFSLGKIRTFLGEHGWPVNTDVQVTETAAHGAGLGREPGTAASAGTPLWVRILLVIVALGLFAAVVAWKVQHGNFR
jgi:hypothetical protein